MALAREPLRCGLKDDPMTLVGSEVPADSNKSPANSKHLVRASLISPVNVSFHRSGAASPPW